MGENCTNLGLQCGLAGNECGQDTLWDDTCHIVEHERRVRHHIGSKRRLEHIEIHPTVQTKFRTWDRYFMAAAYTRNRIVSDPPRCRTV